jgi:hypothetical protein
VFSLGCLLLGHDDMMVRTTRRMWLRCQDCGRDTPGWTIGSEAIVQLLSPRDRCRHSSFVQAAETPQVVLLTPHR